MSCCIILLRSGNNEINILEASVWPPQFGSPFGSLSLLPFPMVAYPVLRDTLTYLFGSHAVCRTANRENNLGSNNSAKNSAKGKHCKRVPEPRQEKHVRDRCWPVRDRCRHVRDRCRQKMYISGNDRVSNIGLCLPPDVPLRNWREEFVFGISTYYGRKIV